MNVLSAVSADVKVWCGENAVINFFFELFSVSSELKLQQLVKRLNLNYSNQQNNILQNSVSQNSIDLNNCELPELGLLVAQLITHWTNEQPLLELSLQACSMSQVAWNEVLQTLSHCKHLTDLNLSENFLGETGHNIAQAIRSWGDEPPLQKVNLNDCSLTAAASLALVQSLSMCRKLRALDLGGNSLGEAGH